jgi:hypothetical protein
MTRRPGVDPGLAGGLREWLEDGVAEVAGALPPEAPPLVVDRRELTGRSVPEPGTAREVTIPLVRGAMVGALFRQLVTTGQTGDPVTDAMAALRVDDGSADIIEFLRRLPAGERAELHREVVAHAANLVSRWPALAPGWYPRTRVRLSIPLAGGRIVLAGVVDLMLGAPPDGRASVCVVDIRSGERRVEHRADLHFLGLLETLRSGAAPFRLATYYSGTGEIDAEDVPDAALLSSVRRTLDSVVHRGRLAARGGA